MKKLLLLAVFIVFTSTNIFSQAIPKQIDYQGVLKTSAGTIVPDGNYQLTFKIYNDPTGGTPLWSEAQTVAVANGIFSAHLGSITPITTVPFNRIHFLGITIGADPELSPRTLLTPSPYSFMAMNVMDNTVVKSLNSLKDDVNLVAGSNITITPSGNNLTISAAGGGGGTVTQVNTGAGLTGGPITTTGTISVANDGITTAMLQNNSVTSSKIVDGTITATDIGSSQVVKSLNSIKDNVNLVAGSNITITPSGQNITIASTASGVGGSGTTNYIPKFTATTTLGNSAIYQTSDGNIGIGTTTPTSKLTVVGGDALINTLNIGFGAGQIETNTALGQNALRVNTTGNNNTAGGRASLYNNSTGSYNSGFGRYALYNNTTGGYNTSVGYSAGDYRLTVEYSSFFGALAYANSDGLTNVAGYGYNTHPTASNQVRIGNSSVTSIGGYAGWTNLSDSRFKVNVNENVKGLDFILKLRPVTYQLDMNKLSKALNEEQRRDQDGNIINTPLEVDVKARNEKSQMVFTGFVAQEVEQVANEIGFNFSGIDKPKNENDFYGLRYAEFVVPLVKAVQEQQKIIEELTKRIEDLERR